MDCFSALLSYLLRVDHGLINNIAVCILVAWLLGVVAHVLRQPLILAYLVAGYIVGPAGLRWVKDENEIRIISDIGLILLLFMIGLEIDIKKMLSAGKTIFVSSLVQVAGGAILSSLFFVLAGYSLGGSKLDALYLGVAASLSSTVIIVKILYQKRELDTLAGRLTLGVLVVQDLFAILFLAFQPDLMHPGILALVKSLLKEVVIVLISFSASRYALPLLFRSVSRLPELVLVGALAWCFLVAGIASALGLSREMGALIAGVAISTFPYTLDVTAKVTCLRDFFVTLFFVSLGMVIPRPTLPMVAMALLVSFIVVATRLVTLFFPLYFLRQGLRASSLTAINLMQVSELSLVILSLGFKEGHLGADTIGTGSYAFVLMALLSSYAITENNRLFLWLRPWLLKTGLRDIGEGDHPESASGHSSARIYILGFSWTASSLVAELSRSHPDLLSDIAVVDFNPLVYERLRQRGVKAIYGDISSRDTLIHAGVAQAELIVCTLPNTVLKGSSNLKLLQQLRQINPAGKIVVHAELVSDVDKLYAAGADYVTLSRIQEALNLAEVIVAADERLLDQKRAELSELLNGRDEVIP